MTNETKIAKATNLTTEEVAVVKNTVAKGTTDLELSYFLMSGKALGLSPFNKEIWCYKDGKGNLLVFAGRDGFLKIAQRSPQWNGMASSEVRANDKFELDIPNGKITHIANPLEQRGEIVGAYAYVKPKGCDVATIEWADFKTYDKGWNVWKSHPADMIKKVAEIRVLKKAFGISGLNSEHEFEVVNDKAFAIDTEAAPTMADIEYLRKLIVQSTYDHDHQDMLINKLHDLTWSEYEAMKSDLMANQLDAMETGSYNQGDIKKALKGVAP
jgi:recombinational DNA repair protein RecT